MYQYKKMTKENRNDLQNILTQALNELKDELGEKFNINKVNLAELERRTGISRGKLRALKDNGFIVKHILDDYSIASQDDIEKSILEKYFENRNQITIDFLLGTDKSEGEMIKEAYRLANKEIGYRIEHLDLKKSKL